MSDVPSLTATGRGPCAFEARGAWTVSHVELLEHLCGGVSHERTGPIDLSGVTALDTVGAWLFEKLARSSLGGESRTAFVGVPAA